MGISWTDEQEKVIRLRDRNMLVSAAAGSGKTAVLVERICQRVLDEENPWDIDELLVVTFTNAAAAEMRSRIAESLENRLAKEPDNVHLQKQVILSRNAQITTIDGFCLNLLKENFYLLDIEPGFQIIDNNESMLLMEDVFDEVINAFYKERSPEFIDFVENYCTGKKDAELSEFVFAMYRNAMAHPWPKKWLQSCMSLYEAKDMNNHPFVDMVWEDCKRALSDVVVSLEEMADEISVYDELDKLNIDLIDIKNVFEGFLSKNTFDEFAIGMRSYSIPRMPTIKNCSVPEVKDAAKTVRDAAKKQFEKIRDTYCMQSPEQIADDAKLALPMMQVLCKLTECFMDAFLAEKKKKNRLDFADIEHMVLSILVNDDGSLTDLAKECQKQYKEIMIDEYQDSNLLQEYILTAVSTSSSGKNNIFMVGDVKQSIYRFRLARPDMFIEKFDRYSDEDSDEQRILLDKNFRSRKEVLDFANDIFRGLMQADFGGIAYDQKAELKLGADYKDMSHDFSAEVMLLDETSFKEEGIDKDRMEAMAIAANIHKAVREGKVTDKKTGQLRPVRYEDIVVLARSSVWWDTLKEVLHEQQIPAIVTGNTGYFNSIEIITMLALLQVIDNRMQDVPLTTVLASPIGMLSKEELAYIKTAYPKDRFCIACVKYSSEGEKEEIKTKLNKLFFLVDGWKRKANYEPVYELLEDIYESTGYYNLVGVMPQGSIRMQNLNMLVEKAYAYENSSYHGLYHFLRYIEKMRKYEIDFPLSGDSVDSNAVRIMTIHKSKGLEFPIVIVSGLSRQFNTMDLKKRLITHPEFGAALEITDGQRRIRRKGFFKNGLKNFVQKENLAEEIRVLYVALTRAKEKLIITGAVKSRDDVDKIFDANEKKTTGLSYTDRLEGKSYMDWILKILAPIRNKYKVFVQDADSLSAMIAYELDEKTREIPWYLDFDKETVSLKNMELVKQEFEYQYPYEEERNIKRKMSVSEIKHRFMEDVFLRAESEESEVPEFLHEEKERIVPWFIDGEEKASGVNPGALRGTAYHRMLECFDFSNEEWLCTDTLDVIIKTQTDKLINEGLITRDMADMVSEVKLHNFFVTDLFKELHYAAKDGTLKKEQPFVMGITPKEAGLDVTTLAHKEPMILVQGIIDVFYEKDGEITLLDYKTDRISSGEELIKRYKKQMELYKDAIERATGKRVKKAILYSFALEEGIDLAF